MTPPPIVNLSAATEIRRAFLQFFEAQGHTRVPSAPLVPNDPSLLFTTAGMVQFKSFYTSPADPPYTRAVSVQKCLRLTDLERVGSTPRHCTFFEMLGNFSFGPREQGAYFKEEAVAMAWDFVTRVLGLPKQRLFVSIFAGEGNLPRDDEAAQLWTRMGLPADHIVALGRADNFWGPAGGQGACGPCSEIYFDLGETRPAHLPADAFWGEAPGDPGDRFMEFWNLVFPQFDAQPDGTLKPLPRPGIDTGMGLERLALLLQEKTIVFETDLFAPILEVLLGQARGHEARPNSLRDARIIADHARALTFAIAEGALPGNEGAGYVLRRLLRRAVVRARSRRGLEITTEGVMDLCATEVVARFGGHYTELESHREPIRRVLRQEEDAFIQTYESGMTRLEKLLEPGTPIDGREAFELHDTYGFPVELTEEIAAERGVRVDREGFERAMETQRARARAASKFGKGAEGVAAPWTDLTPGADSKFLGYDALEAAGLTVRRWREAPGDDGALDVVLDRTPCYAESGGQVSDRGWLRGEGVEAALVHVFREGESIVHRLGPGVAREALFQAGRGSGLTAVVDAGHRRPTTRHHTATHLLHAVLRRVLGPHVRQAGSLVAPDRLRFDYTHFEAPTPEQLAAIEVAVVEWVLCNTAVHWEVLPLDAARERGAMALFGEKYGAEVRMVTVEGADADGAGPSLELCGGTHVARTGDIGAFVLIGDAAIASGVRRIEALCGHEALQWLKVRSAVLERVAAVFQVRPELVPEQIERLRETVDQLKKAQAEARRGGLEAEMGALVTAASAGAQGRWVVARLEAEADAQAARDAADRLRGALGRGAAVLALQGGGKWMLLASATDDLVAEKKINASDLIRRVAQVAGGSGGGKPHLALAGVKDPDRIDAALDEARRLLGEVLGS